MKKTRFLFVLALLCLQATQSLFAYDFEVDGVYYTLLSSKERTVSVSWSENVDLYIPSEVVYNDKKFSVTEIGEGSSGGFRYANSVIIEDGVSVIKESAFQDTKIKLIKIPKSIVKIESNAFKSTNSEKSVYIESIKNWCNIDFGNFASNPLSGNFYVNEILTEDIRIPSGVEYIKPYVFSRCKIKSVTIDDGVKKIGHHAFWQCSNLESVFIANSVIQIDENAFHQCSNLSSIVLPSNLTEINAYTFAGCTSLKNISIPMNMRSIKYMAFDMTGLLSISLPKQLESIEKEAFAYCDSLLLVEANMTTPFIIDKSVFSGRTYLDGKLIVPSQTREKYMNTEYWNEFMNIEEQGQQNSFCLSVSCNKGGEIIFLGNAIREQVKSVEIIKNQDVTLTITPDDGYHIKTVTLNGKDVKDDLNNNNYTIAQIKENMDFRVEFAKTATYLSLKQPSGSMDVVVKEGESQTVRLVPESGYTIHSVTFNGLDVTSQLSEENVFVTPEIFDNAVLYVVYENGGTPPENHAKYLTIKHSENGVVKQRIVMGRSYTYKISPVSGQKLAALYFNGVDVTSEIKGGKFATPVLNDNATLEVEFEAR